MIEVENLTKHYGKHVAVSDIGFRVRPGEIVGFLGPNGAGKSTTLRMLSGFLTPTAGTIRIHGIDAIADPLRARAAIGYMPESVPLYREMRVTEYLRYRAGLKGVSRRLIKDRVGKALELAQVNDVSGRIIGQLSKGYRSRVGLADVFLADPPLLILDEPTAGLDPNQIRGVRDMIRSLAGEKTVLLSTHILPEVESTCSRVVIINKGRVVGEGEPGKLRGKGLGGQVLVLRGRGTVVEFDRIARTCVGVDDVLDQSTPESGLTELRLRVKSPDVAEELFRAFATADRPLLLLRPEQASLEDVFAQLTTADRAESPPVGGDAT